MRERTHILRRSAWAALLAVLNLMIATSCIALPPTAPVDVRARELAASSTPVPVARAPSRSCGSQCDNKDPATYLVRVPGDAYYCHDAITFALLDTNIGNVELRYSPICRTAWTRGCCEIPLAGFSYHSNGTFRMQVDEYSGSYPPDWTTMLDAAGLPFKACFWPYSSTAWSCTDLLPTAAAPAMSCYIVCDGQNPSTARYEDANGGLRRCTDARIIHRRNSESSDYVELRYSRNCRMAWAQGRGSFKVEGFNANGSLRVIFQKAGPPHSIENTLAVNDAGLTARACVSTGSAGWLCTPKY